MEGGSGMFLFLLGGVFSNVNKQRVVGELCDNKCCGLLCWVNGFREMWGMCGYGLIVNLFWVICRWKVCKWSCREEGGGGRG